MEKSRTIVVKGIGKVSVSPDLTVIEMSLKSLEKQYEVSLGKAAEQIESVRSALIAVGFEKSDLKTTDFNVCTRYSSVKDRSGNYHSVFEGFEVSHSLKLEFDFDMKKLDEVLGALANCEAHPKFSIEFSVKDKNAVNEALLKEAVDNATRKAQVLATAANVKLGQLLNIDYNWGELHLVSRTSYAYEEEACKMCAPTMGMEIEPDDIDVSDTATLVWEIV